MRALLSLNGALLLILGIVPGALLALCANVFIRMFGG
jgi:NADH-quinone oxidoreductase subunit N